MIITRKALGWPAVESPRANTDKGIIVHYDGSNQKLAKKVCAGCRAYWLKTRIYHVEGHGWADIGYAYGVCPHGNIYEGRGYGRVQAAAKQSPGKLPDGNDRWVNVTFMSGPDEWPTPVQIEAFKWLRHKLQVEHNLGASIKGHRDFTSTDCPGSHLYNMVKDDAFKAMGDPSNPKPPVEVKVPPFPGRVFIYTAGKTMMRGHDIELWQSRMRARGWDIVNDGVYGPKSKIVAMQFQREKHLTVDGKVGPQTWRAAWTSPVT